MVPLDGDESGWSENGFRQPHGEIWFEQGEAAWSLFELGAARPKLKEASPGERWHGHHVVVAHEEDQLE